MNWKRETLAKFLSFGAILMILFFNFGVSNTFSGDTGVGTSSGVSLSNPLKADSFTELADNIADFLIKIAGPIAVIMVIYAGFLFMTSGGDEKKFTEAKSTLTWAVVGLAVLILAKSVTTILNELFSGS